MQTFRRLTLTSVHGSRFLISQGKDRINLTVAEHHEQYLQYLDQTRHDPPITDTSVLRLQTFGSVKVKDSEAMKQFVIHMTAVMLFIKRSCTDQLEESVSYVSRGVWKGR
jgi:hypothetical protein